MKYMCEFCSKEFQDEVKCSEHEQLCSERLKYLEPRIRVVVLTLFENGKCEWTISFVESADELDCDCPVLDEVYSEDGIAGELRVIRMASYEDEISEHEQKLQLLKYEIELSTADLKKEQRVLSSLEAEEAQLKAEHNQEQKK